MFVARIGGYDPDFQIACATTAGHHVRVQTVGQVKYLILAGANFFPGFFRIAHVDKLHLTDDNRIRACALKPAGLQHGFGR